MTPAPVVVLISGRGSNLQALIDASRQGLPIEIRAVISNKMQAPGLERARAVGIATSAIDHRDYPQRADFDQALMAAIDQHHPRFVVLAGFMRILGPAFIAHYRGRLINIHPSLLPAFPGLDTHTRALAAGAKEHGASVHYVTDTVDAGPIIAQARIPVLASDTPETLAARVLEEEHRLFPLALRWLVEGRVRYQDGQAVIDPTISS